MSYAIAAAAQEVGFARSRAACAEADRDRAETRARAARRGSIAASARSHVLGDTVADLRRRLSDAQAVIDDLVDENRELRSDAARLADYIAEHC